LFQLKTANEVSNTSLISKRKLTVKSLEWFCYGTNSCRT
jgi:hypothetical protein